MQIVMALIAGVMFISFALYQLFYIIELTRGALKKDDVQIVDAFTDDDDTTDNSGKSDELVFSDEEKRRGLCSKRYCRYR